MPYLEPSRPMPDLLHAAERRHFGRDDALVDADDAVFQRLGHAHHAADIARVEIGGEAVLRVVRDPDRFGFVLEAEQRRDRPEDFLARRFPLPASPASAWSARRTCRRARGDGRRSRPRAPFAVASASRRSTFSTAFTLISGPCVTPSSTPFPTFSFATRAASFSANAS